MNHWKIILEHCGTALEIELKAKGYADAFVKAGTGYPQCSVVSIKQIKSESKLNTKKIN